ncbi:MAG: pilus assembly protein [Pseudomonadota bacterium]
MMMKRLVKYMRHFLLGTQAATAIAFALLIPLVVGAGGMGVDLATAYMVRQRLSHALDAAALAAAASGDTGTALQARVDSFLQINYPSDKIGATYDLTVHEMSGGRIQVSARANFDPFFVDILGIHIINVYAETVVSREIRGLEVAMVLDVTGSMATNNNIGALRTAATNFVNILFNRAVFDDNIKIGLVPFATAVNVGPYGLGKNPDGTFYDTPFVSNPNNMKWNVNKTTDWWGCVLTRTYPEDTMDSQASWRWNMFRFTYQGSNESYYRNNYRTEDPKAGINYGCNKSYIQPLTSNRTQLLSRISGLRADGSTLSNLGMVWGYRVLSPGFPFREGADWGNAQWRKAVVLMTDGDNYLNPHYSAYGTYQGSTVRVNHLNARLAETCTRMKEQGIKVYTVTFTSDISNATRNFYRSCATDSSKYFDAPTQDDLVDVFERISLELSNIHISN